jgi:hypothetical protein
LALFEQIQKENAAINDPEREKPDCFMGDSITEFCVKCIRILSDKFYINRGISGQTSPQMLHDLELT